MIKIATLIKLNNHRLLNGDAANKEDVSQLIGEYTVNLLLTDPPYGINIVNMNHDNENGTVGTAAQPGFKEYGTVGTTGIVEPRQYKPIIGDDKPFNPQHLLDLNVPSIIFGYNCLASLNDLIATSLVSSFNISVLYLSDKTPDFETAETP